MNTLPPVAPSDFMVAMVSRLRSRWPRIAFATPTPPTSSAVRPTSVRYCVKRSMLRSSPGEALLRLRTSQPASGTCALARVDRALHGGIAGVVVGQAQAIVPAHLRARLQQAGGAQRLRADHQPRPETEAAGRQAVGLGR